MYPVLLISCPHIPLLPFLFLRSLDCGYKSLRRRRSLPSLQIQGAARTVEGCVKLASCSRGTRSPIHRSFSPCAPSSLARGAAAVEEGGAGGGRAFRRRCPRASFWLRKTAVSLSNDQRCQLNQSEDSEIMTNECKQPIVAEVNK